MKIKKIKKCLLCDGKLTQKAFPFSTIYNKIKFNYLKCNKCHSTCIHPTPNKNTLEIMYQKDNYHKIYYKNYDTIKYIKSVMYLRKFIDTNSTILDYGCGSGYFIKALKKYNYKVIGVDYDEKLINDLKSEHEVYTVKELEQIKNIKFNAIHLGDVLEHMVEPIKLIKFLINKLNNNGLIYIEGPLERNISLVNYSILIFGNFRNILFPFLRREHTPTHLFFVNLKSQINFFNQFTNLSIIDYQVSETGWPYKNNGIIKNLIAKFAIFFGGKKFFSNIFGNRISIILKVND